jgi:DNA polymerase-3 subunit epsilon
MAPAASQTQRIDEASFIVLDFETTIVSLGKLTFPEPIELAAMRIGPGRAVDPSFTFSSLIRPPTYAPIVPFITQLTGIRQEDVADAPPLEDVLSRLDAHLKTTPSVLVAHYAPFDAGIIWRFVQHCPSAARCAVIDSCALARRLVPGLRRYGLDHLVPALGFEIPADRHRALADVEVTVQVFLELLRRADEQGYGTVEDLRALGGIPTPRFRTRRFQQKLFEE